MKGGFTFGFVNDINEPPFHLADYCGAAESDQATSQ